MTPTIRHHAAIAAVLTVAAAAVAPKPARAATEPPLLGFTHSAVMAGQPVQVCLFNVSPTHRPIITSALSAFTAATNAATQGHGVAWVEGCSTYGNTIMPSLEVGGGDTTWMLGPPSQVVIRYNPNLSPAWLETTIKHELLHGFWNTGHVPCGPGPSLMGPVIGCAGAWTWQASDLLPGCRYYRPQWCGGGTPTATPTATATATPTPTTPPATATPTATATPACWWGGRSWLCP